MSVAFAWQLCAEKLPGAPNPESGTSFHCELALSPLSPLQSIIKKSWRVISAELYPTAGAYQSFERPALGLTVRLIQHQLRCYRCAAVVRATKSSDRLAAAFCASSRCCCCLISLDRQLRNREGSQNIRYVLPPRVSPTFRCRS